MASPHVLDREIAAYNAMRDELERDHLYDWVVFHDEEFIGAYEDFQDAAAEAVRRFGRGPYLIRQVGRPALTVPTVFPPRPKSRQMMSAE